ncbi:ran-binding 3 isoform X2 [Brachionus plicatilis]|uniref:Ran-binding 3 isoform X2 n=1 Tax=Brachionus plicatilis TaxID=10195 RepID=A0A3M7PBC3_BRAPC|nr:ran-binding 3 isoform X2 [Brachionus plicatilis]
MSMRGKFSLKPSALSQHTANFNKILEQVPTPKVDNIELIKPAEIKSAEPISIKEPTNQENKVEKIDEKKEFVFGEQLTDRVIRTEASELDQEESKELSEIKPATLWTGQVDTDEKFDNELDSIFKLNCKLFVLESDKASWSERGYGLLKLIDTPDRSNCKIMMWTDKCYRLILNTKLFDKMQIDKANKKSIRFNAFDNGTIRIFLIKSSNPNDCEELFEILQMRLEEFTSKLSTSQLTETKNFVLKCDCKLYKNDEETNRSSRIDLYSLTDSISSELFLDIVDKDTEQVLVTTLLKSIKISNSKANQFEIDEFSFTVYSADPKPAFKIVIMDQDKEKQIMDLYKKEINDQIEDASNGELEENKSEDLGDENSPSITKETRSDGDDSKSQLDFETGESKRKRKTESDESESESNAKKIEIENQSNKRSAEENESEEADSSKKTRVDN